MGAVVELWVRIPPRHKRTHTACTLRGTSRGSSRAASGGPPDWKFLAGRVGQAGLLFRFVLLKTKKLDNSQPTAVPHTSSNRGDAGELVRRRISRAARHTTDCGLQRVHREELVRRPISRAARHTNENELQRVQGGWTIIQKR
jgi:hypothetical protein